MPRVVCRGRHRPECGPFVIDGGMTTYKATIKERNLWIDTLILMASRAPVVLVAGNHGAEWDGDLYVYTKARGKFPVYLCTAGIRRSRPRRDRCVPVSTQG